MQQRVTERHHDKAAGLDKRPAVEVARLLQQSQAEALAAVGSALAEIAAGAGQPLPRKRRLLAHRIGGERSDRVQCRGGATYQACFQLESVAPELFWSFQEELVSSGSRRGLLYRFESGGRMALGGVSLIELETGPRSLLVQAFHTFPDELAIVKTQSLFEAP